MFPRVKEILWAAENGGIEAVKLYFNQPGMDIDPSTWSGNIKKTIDKGLTITAMAEIELIKNKFNHYNNDVSKEGRRTSSDKINGQGNKDN